ncbi:MAG: hypothetical protein ABL907_07405 [Hyphomicrobium sp.]
MPDAFNQFLALIQQGISAIFRFVGTVWTWAASQIQSLTTVPWSAWPVWKQIVLALIIVGVAIALFKVVAELWTAGERILAAFATLVGVFVRTLPSVAIAGLIALCGLWVLNNVDLGSMKFPMSWQSSADSSAVERPVR